MRQRRFIVHVNVLVVIKLRGFYVQTIKYGWMVKAPSVLLPSHACYKFGCYLFVLGAMMQNTAARCIRSWMLSIIMLHAAFDFHLFTELSFLNGTQSDGSHFGFISFLTQKLAIGSDVYTKNIYWWIQLLLFFFTWKYRSIRMNVNWIHRQGVPRICRQLRLLRNSGFWWNWRHLCKFKGAFSRF